MVWLLLCGVGCSAGSPPDRVPSLPTTPSPLPSVPVDARPVQPVPDVRPPGFADPPAGHGLARYRGQQLVWRACGALRCATILVPLDYARTDGAAISLTVARRVVTHGTAHGIVVTNPGGPGGSGVEFLSGLRGDPFGDVDVVSWDPRGSGGSTPVRCWDQAAQDAYAELDGSPDDAGERSALVSAAQRFGLSCLAGSGRLLAHVSTVESARDLDLIRDALGVDRVDYVGFSNGTLLGADYAQLYPGRVGRFVLDGAVNISGSPVVQLEGFDRALRAMLDWCVAQRGGCELGTSQQDAVSTLTAFWTRLDAAPLPVGNRMLTQTLAVDGVVAALYSGVSGYPELRSALIGAIRHGDGRGLLELADRLLGLEDGSWTQFAVAYPASECADEPNTGLVSAWREAAADARRAPILGPVDGLDIECAVWPVDSARGPGKLTAPDAPPLIVIGTTGDPATPYEWAQGMADQLTSAVLVTHRGAGHTSFGSDCYPTVVQPFLATGQLPARGATC